MRAIEWGGCCRNADCSRAQIYDGLKISIVDARYARKMYTGQTNDTSHEWCVMQRAIAGTRSLNQIADVTIRYYVELVALVPLLTGKLHVNGISISMQIVRDDLLMVILLGKKLRLCFGPLVAIYR